MFDDEKVKSVTFELVIPKQQNRLLQFYKYERSMLDIMRIYWRWQKEISILCAVWDICCTDLDWIDPIDAATKGARMSNDIEIDSSGQVLMELQVAFRYHNRSELAESYISNKIKEFTSVPYWKVKSIMQTVD